MGQPRSPSWLLSPTRLGDCYVPLRVVEDSKVALDGRTSPGRHSQGNYIHTGRLCLELRLGSHRRLK